MRVLVSFKSYVFFDVQNGKRVIAAIFRYATFSAGRQLDQGDSHSIGARAELRSVSIIRISKSDR